MRLPPLDARAASRRAASLTFPMLYRPLPVAHLMPCNMPCCAAAATRRRRSAQGLSRAAMRQQGELALPPGMSPGGAACSTIGAHAATLSAHSRVMFRARLR